MAAYVYSSSVAWAPVHLDASGSALDRKKNTQINLMGYGGCVKPPSLKQPPHACMFTYAIVPIIALVHWITTYYSIK